MAKSRDVTRQTAAFAKEDRRRTWLELALTLAVVAGLSTLTFFAPVWLKIVPAFLVGLTWVRMFIFFHDWAHKAIFTKSPLGDAVMTVYGVITMVPPSVWQQTHDYHHQNNAKMVGASIGSYPLITVRMYKSLKPNLQFWYRVARHPLTMLFGYFTIFLGGMCISAFRRDPSAHRLGPVSIVVHYALGITLGLTLGWTQAFFLFFLPMFVSCAVGCYLFYAQHNFPSIQLRDRREWDFTFAALHSSSMFEMSPIMHWLTGNIGYHHIHHLNHKVPFYRLPEAYAAVEGLQSPGRTSWAPSEVWACLQLKLWDPDKQRMVSWDEADESPAASPA